MRKLPLLALAALAVTLGSGLPAAPAQAATRHLYVSPNGNDHNSGTAASPFRQVQRAADAATAGTVVHVAPGTYGAVTSTRSGTASAPIQFVSTSRWGAVISARTLTTAWTNTGSYVTISRFTITGARYNGILTTASHGRFLGNHIHGLAAPDCSRGGAGIVAESYSAVDNDIIGNRIHHITVPGDCARIHGIYLQSPSAGRVMNNLVFQTAGWGIHLWHNARNIVISSNTVFQNKKGGMVIGASLEGNDQAPGIAEGVIVTNNIAAWNGDWGIREMGRVGKNTYANNLVYGNSAGGLDIQGGGSPTGTIAASPQFLRWDPSGAGDYRLRSTSPAVDRGTSLRAPGYDLLLTGRPLGRTFDVGAYEGGH